MKKTVQVYLAMSILGVLLIGLGCGISVFEVSNYKTANYNATIPDPELPAIETTTETMELTLTGSQPFQLDVQSWGWLDDTNCTIEVDNTLTDRVLIHVTQPKDLFYVYLDRLSDNAYRFGLEHRDLEMFRLALQIGRQGYLVSDWPRPTITIVMNEAQAKDFQVNAAQMQRSELEETYNNELFSMEQNYQEQLSEQADQYQEQLTIQQENYENSLQEIEAQIDDYEQQLLEKDNQINELNQQLETIRNSLN